MSKKQKRSSNISAVHNGMVLREIHPKTYSQQVTFDFYDEGSHLFLHGCPGTGKTFLSLYLALREVLTDESKHNITIIRSAQPSKDMGHLPGNVNEKMRQYESPYKGICIELFRRGDAYDILKGKNLIDFQPTSFLRGTNIDNSIIILDEAQNLSYMELKTVLTRVGENTRIIICGDSAQDDLTSIRYNERSGLDDIKHVLSRMPSVSMVEFGIQDIVRSGFVKEFILAETNQGEGRIRLAS